MSVWDTQRCLWLPAKTIRCTADHAYLIETPAGSQYIRTHDHLKAHHVAAHQTAEETEELKPSVPVTVPHATALTVAPATSATPDKPSVLPLKPLPTALATLQSSLPHQGLLSLLQQLLHLHLCSDDHREPS